MGEGTIFISASWRGDFIDWKTFMHLLTKLNQLKHAYPNYIQSVTPTEIMWRDGTSMPVGEITDPSSTSKTLENPSLANQLLQAAYPAGRLSDHQLQHLTTDDPGRIRYTPFFTKMYGESSESAEKHLITVPWLPELFLNQYAIKVTTVNDVHKKLRAISSELASLPTQFHSFLEGQPETFEWREIAATRRLSPHSFGIAIDINVRDAHYWLWELQKLSSPINSETLLQENALPPYQNNLPWEIVLIFEKYGFIWGGKWRHYDTMHFEYRPELLTFLK